VQVISKASIIVVDSWCIHLAKRSGKTKTALIRLEALTGLALEVLRCPWAASRLSAPVSVKSHYCSK
jgi:hypothetical protein